MIDLKNKIIVVTGGEGLLGKEFIAQLTSAGATVISADVKKTTTHEFIELDITNEKSVSEAIDKIISKHQVIHGWVNNAYPRTSDWANKPEDVTMESWRKNIDMHLNGYYLCCSKVLQQMKKQKFGSLINMSSIYGINAPDFSVYEGTDMTMPIAYSAIKGGLISLTKYLAAYYGPFNVRVNCISPGGIENNQPASFVKNYNQKVPLKRLGKPADIAPAVAFLLSDSASYITGHNLVIDGGWTIV